MANETDIHIRVSAGTPVGKLAGAIKANYDSLKQENTIVLRCVGAAPTCQAVKSIAILNQFLAREGMVCLCCPGLVKTDEKIRGSETSETINITELVLHFKRLK